MSSAAQNDNVHIRDILASLKYSWRTDGRDLRSIFVSAMGTKPALTSDRQKRLPCLNTEDTNYGKYTDN